MKEAGTSGMCVIFGPAIIAAGWCEDDFYRFPVTGSDMGSDKFWWMRRLRIMGKIP
jgi:hypothetical protein